ncbi:MAG: aminotransferase class V-fold PLP-dependent enzyme [Candidatus Acidiferrales bacterium]
MKTVKPIAKGRRDFLRHAASAGLVAMSVPLLRAESALSGGRAERAAQMGGGVDAIRKQFPVLAQKVNGHDLVFLDSAATTQRPLAVINAITDFYFHDNANPSKATHTLAARSAEHYDRARATVARFLNARSPLEIVWTHGTTEAINLVATSWGGANLREGDEIVLTIEEHYSNLVPWQLAAKRAGAKLKFLDVADDGSLRVDQLPRLLTAKTKLVVFTQVSNVLGLVNPVREICDIAHKAGALAFVDGAQSLPHFPVDVQALGCDFFAFSGHKICGPMGTGGLWAQREILDAMPPYQSGSIMVHEVDANVTPEHFAEGGLKFTAGTPDVCGAVGVAAAIGFLESIRNAQQLEFERRLTEHALARLGEVKGLRMIGPMAAKDRVPVFTFVIEGRDPQAIVKALDAKGIAVRAGDMAALPLLKRFGVSAAVRASCNVYTTTEEVDALTEALK